MVSPQAAPRLPRPRPALVSPPLSWRTRQGSAPLPGSSLPSDSRVSLLTLAPARASGTTLPAQLPRPSTPPRRRLTQRTLRGPSRSQIDTDAWGHLLPTSPPASSSIFTFQNVGPQPVNSSKAKARRLGASFAATRASVALYAEHGLINANLPIDHSFTS